jgi:EpsI family protein
VLLAIGAVSPLVLLDLSNRLDPQKPLWSIWTALQHDPNLVWKLALAAVGIGLPIALLCSRRVSRPDRLLLAVFVAGGVLNVAAMRSAAGREYTMPPDISLPAVVDDWTGSPLPVEENYHAILPHSRIVASMYNEKGGLPVILNVIASRDPNDMHTPDRCIIGSGFEIVSDELTTLTADGPNPASWPMHEMHIAKSDSDELVYYGYDGLRSFGGFTLLARIAMKVGILGASKRPAYFVRFSTPVGGDIAAARARLVTLARRMMEIRSTWEVKPKASENT